MIILRLGNRIHYAFLYFCAVVSKSLFLFFYFLQRFLSNIKKIVKRAIWLIDGTLTDIISLGQSGPRSNGLNTNKHLLTKANLPLSLGGWCLINERTTLSTSNYTSPVPLLTKKNQLSRFPVSETSPLKYHIEKNVSAFSWLNVFVISYCHLGSSDNLQKSLDVTTWRIWWKLNRKQQMENAGILQKLIF